MNMKKHSLFFMAALALLTTGCSVYQPQVVDIPLIDHAGETSVNASAGISMWYTPTVGVTASHGFNDWLAGQAFVSYSFSSAHTHVAAGYYKRLGEKARLECYGGMGFGGKLANSFFESVTLRTAGFTTFPQENLRLESCIVAYLFMFIGGSPIGTAGGIKTTTFFLLIMNVRSGAWRQI